MTKMRQPMIYHMYIGRYSNRNNIKAEASSAADLKKFLFQRIDVKEYNTRLQLQYEDHIIQTGRGFFDG